MPAWPAGLPQYVMEQGFSEAMPDQMLETAMEAGKVKSRRRFTTNSRVFSCAVAMTAAERLVFEEFYFTTLMGGSLTFTWVHPLHQTAGTFRFRKPVPKFTVRGEANIAAFAMEQIG